MTEERGWRDAKLPKWAAEDVERELAAWKLTAALMWPTEAEPEPVPFQWGEYGRLKGEAVPGLYWQGGQYCANAVHIRKARDDEKDAMWRNWRFSSDGEKWSPSVVRGPLYTSAHDAQLAFLWRACREYAAVLLRIRETMR